VRPSATVQRGLPVRTYGPTQQRPTADWRSARERLGRPNRAQPQRCLERARERGSGEWCACTTASVVRPTASGGGPTTDQGFTGGFSIPLRTRLTMLGSPTQTVHQERQQETAHRQTGGGTVAVVGGKVRRCSG
jgi:hypothetical protein